MTQRIGVDPAKFEPVSDWTRIYFMFARVGFGARTTRSIGGLRDNELGWVARVVLAEIRRRNISPSIANSSKISEEIMVPERCANSLGRDTSEG